MYELFQTNALKRMVTRPATNQTGEGERAVNQDPTVLMERTHQVKSVKTGGPQRLSDGAVKVSSSLARYSEIMNNITLML